MDDIIEAAAIALSMADPDERGLPEAVAMNEFYRSLARAAIAAIMPAIGERFVWTAAAALGNETKACNKRARDALRALANTMAAEVGKG